METTKHEPITPRVTFDRQQPQHSGIETNESIEGETIEEKVQRIVETDEPITDGAPEIFTERRDGVLPEYNIRTDRFDIAVEAMGQVTKSKLTKRQEALAELKKKNEPTPETQQKTD
nr:MAG: hypothetical protein [Microviridae sp.]